LRDIKIAAAPATKGDAIDVPLVVLVAASSKIPADLILDPGAKILTHEP